jgi:hypothetical protein
MHIVTAKDQRRAMAFVETRAAAADNVVSITGTGDSEACRKWAIT